MDTQLLIEAVVRQSMVLIAGLATHGGARTPLGQLGHQVFKDLALELEAQGVSRKVTADMFGISLRSFQRKLNRLSESRTDRGRTLWEVVFEYLSGAQVRSRAEVFRRFARDEESSVRGILRDLVESGVVFVTGTGPDAVYRVVRSEDLEGQALLSNDALLWALVYREGPFSSEDLEARFRADPKKLQQALARLESEGHVQSAEQGGVTRYSARRFVMDGSSGKGWEAALYDHFAAVVRTLCARIDPDTASEDRRQYIGGSTYSLDVGPEHPLEREVLGTLARLRSELSELRRRVNEHNDQHPEERRDERVVLYFGQHLLPRENADATKAGEEAES